MVKPLSTGAAEVGVGLHSIDRDDQVAAQRRLRDVNGTPAGQVAHLLNLHGRLDGDSQGLGHHAQLVQDLHLPGTASASVGAHGRDEHGVAPASRNPSTTTATTSGSRLIPRLPTATAARWPLVIRALVIARSSAARLGQVERQRRSGVVHLEPVKVIDAWAGWPAETSGEAGITHGVAHVSAGSAHRGSWCRCPRPRAPPLRRNQPGWLAVPWLAVPWLAVPWLAVPWLAVPDP